MRGIIGSDKRFPRLRNQIANRFRLQMIRRRPVEFRHANNFVRIGNLRRRSSCENHKKGEYEKEVIQKL
jgi:hypothetical protein